MSNAILSAKQEQEIFESPMLNDESSDESLVDNEPEIRLTSPGQNRVVDYGSNQERVLEVSETSKEEPL